MRCKQTTTTPKPKDIEELIHEGDARSEWKHERPRCPTCLLCYVESCVQKGTHRSSYDTLCCVRSPGLVHRRGNSGVCRQASAVQIKGLCPVATAIYTCRPVLFCSCISSFGSSVVVWCARVCIVLTAPFGGANQHSEWAQRIIRPLGVPGRGDSRGF